MFYFKAGPRMQHNNGSAQPASRATATPAAQAHNKHKSWTQSHGMFNTNAKYANNGKGLQPNQSEQRVCAVGGRESDT